MTIRELMDSEKVIVTPAEVAPVLGMHPQVINLMAREGTLPFRYIRSGNRTKIPRIPLLQWLGAIPENGGQREAQDVYRP